MSDLWSKIRNLVRGDIENKTVNVNKHPTPEVNVVVRRPSSFAEAEPIAALVKGGQAVVVNFEGVPMDTAQRLVDYLSGATYALDGNMEKIGTAIFLFAPLDVNIQSRDLFRLKEE
ncbi:MAG: cell division protein SepF [Firmicutes bacterium]|nr:cell division protein SepF [Bacillota bacterium]